MGLFGSSKSSSNVTNNTTNKSTSIATEAGGKSISVSDNATLNFEDLNEDVVNSALELAKGFLSETGGFFDKAFSTTSTALTTTQDLAQNLIEENNTPSSDNMRNIIYALSATTAIVGGLYFWSKKR